MRSPTAGYAADVGAAGRAVEELPERHPADDQPNDCVFWIDYTTVAEEEDKLGIHLDTNTTTGRRRGPGRCRACSPVENGASFLTVDGTLLDVYQAATQLTDESGQAYPPPRSRSWTARSTRATRGVRREPPHDGNDAGTYHDVVIAAAEQRASRSSRASSCWTGRTAGRLVVREPQPLGRRRDFTLKAGDGANGLQAMMPIDGSTARSGRSRAAAPPYRSRRSR